jgi:PTH1 family peptidyl-tRNA hydrolase
MKLIVGLGNPGRGYAHNRHNIGFLCLSHFARTEGIRFDKKKGNARIGTGKAAGSKVVLAKPQTYMNHSGQSVSLLVNRFDINPDDLLVIHDDLDLTLGKIRISRGSGSGGHKGVNSIIYSLESQDFIRIRVGIGRPMASPTTTSISEDGIIAYVLSDFTAEEKKIVSQVIPRVSEAIYCLLSEGLAVAMNKYN